ncbi:MAG: sigma-54-dependent Fis family transcriptional regulator [Desulfobulbaceae bacterium]|nr:sigma-54-dependent Fis family transcriptional regulator [Desulfobulbaceae bacterium]
MDLYEILIAVRNHRLRNDIQELLINKGFNVIDTASKRNIAALINKWKPSLLIAGSSWDTTDDGLKMAEEIHRDYRGLPIILIASQSNEDQAIRALRIGIKDYFKVPYCDKELVGSVKRCLKEHYITNDKKFDFAPPEFSRNTTMVGESRSMQEIKTHIRRLALTDSNVLITGETGTGKELAAELLHNCSRRKRKALVCVNCAAIPENLIESELFGLEKGAFTGADAKRKGKFEQADKGTIFLDEIGDMSVCAQAKILRAVDTKRICRVGGGKEIAVNVRGVAATNQDLEKLIEENKFRSDLYYRLNVGRVQLPPLRDRKEDIPSLVNYYIEKLNKVVHGRVHSFTDDSWKYLFLYDWPGNVRELKNVVESSFVEMADRNMEFIRLPDYLKRKIDAPLQFVTTERESLLTALHATNWNKSKAAEKLCWSRMTLYRKMKRYKILLQ